ncbi:2OG-Fe dioxygenase family protein [Nannocystis bainbridge]|uniref:2OG-Fe dioxygenase family protein n=1 Tax=Nannocystis bainbridge TaxID=2995303 RepID=A0ABT5E4W8_9BACT|nr:2OG-Fe dioxygenase family protein [Nannocystis bainbridge]MDC0720914.1 2OG-Fe dioxygenase family protein [Nannocystis bainbridge]
MTRPIPPFTDPADVEAAVRRDGYALVSARGLASWLPQGLGDLQALQPSWDDLPPDTYLRDGGRYRRRRHSCFVVEGLQVELTPHRAHWQPLEYNALHGGLERWFEPMLPEVTAQPVWAALLRRLGATCSALAPAVPRWFVEAHQFRIDTSDGIGRPTPEGAHRDGVDFVVVVLVARRAIKGGETRVFQAEGPHGLRFMMREPWTLLLLDDARVIHEATPIQPLDEAGGHRDTLVLTFRAGGFQGPG